jgi:TRAP-type mannitol/chloroaromatic compound transport system permease small subunit
MSVSTGTPGAQGAGGDFPPVFYGTIRIIDRFSDLTGRLFALVQIFLVVTITYEVVVRYFFNAPTVWVFESSAMANGASFMLACGYALSKGAHVRTDIFWDKYSERKKGTIDGAWHSYITGERSQESIWRAIMWPFRSAIPLAALLFMIQGVSESLKCCYQIRFGREFQHRAKLEV